MRKTLMVFVVSLIIILMTACATNTANKTVQETETAEKRTEATEGTMQVDETVQKLIDDIAKLDIESMSLGDKESVEELNKIYSDLSDSQKSNVSNYQLLSDAIKRISELEEQEKKLKEECLADIKSGLEERWELSRKPIKTLEERIQNRNDIIDSEYNKIAPHKDDPIYDIDFKANITNYISALELMKEGNQYFPSDPDNYNELYINEGFAKRAECLNYFVTNCNLSVDSKYSEKLKSSLSPDGIYKLCDPIETRYITSKLGSAYITIEGVEVSSTWTEYARNNEIKDNQSILLLKLIVENIDFYDDYNSGYMDLEWFFSLADLSGFTIESLSSAWEYGGYESAAGAFFEIGKGEKKHVVVPYPINNDDSIGYIYFGDGYFSLLEW